MMIIFIMLKVLKVFEIFCSIKDFVSVSLRYFQSPDAAVFHLNKLLLLLPYKEDFISTGTLSHFVLALSTAQNSDQVHISNSIDF